MGGPVDFPGTNRKLVAPKGQEETVGDLPSFNNGKVSVSCWQLSATEMDEVVRTGRVWVAIWWPDTQPPMYVGDSNTVREVVADYGPIWRR